MACAWLAMRASGTRSRRRSPILRRMGESLGGRCGGEGREVNPTAGALSARGDLCTAPAGRTYLRESATHDLVLLNIGAGASRSFPFGLEFSTARAPAPERTEKSPRTATS